MSSNGTVCYDTGDTAWLSLSTVLVLSMMPGLALFEAGLLRVQNTVSVLTQIFVGLAMLSAMWFLFGFSFVFGHSQGGFIGSPSSFPGFANLQNTCLLRANKVPALSYAMFQMMFAAITPLLLTGAYSERLLFRPFLVFTFLWEFLVYYPVAHWIWGGGWLARMGALDFAGGIVIHTTAGVSAIVAALMLGRRSGFYENDGEFKPSNLPLASVGGAMLWAGWFGFNAGSALSAGELSATVITNTQLASSTCCLVWLAVAFYRGHPNIVDALNGAIAGLAGITPAAGYLSPWSAFVSGIVLGLSSYFSLELLRFRLHIDDALDVSSVHGVTGVVGALIIGFAAERSVNDDLTHNGIFFGDHGHLLGVQTLAIIVSGAWAGFWTFVIFKCLHWVGHRFPLLKLSMGSDAIGLDALDHDVDAYRMNVQTTAYHPLTNNDELA